MLSIEAVALAIPNEPGAILEYRDPEQIQHVLDEITLLHKHVGIPIEYRRYWPDRDILQAAGFDYPSFVKARGYDGRRIPLPANSEARTAQMSDVLGLGVLTGSSSHNKGWVFIVGQDQNGRRAYVVAIPPNDAQAYLPKLLEALRLTPTAIKRPPPPRISPQQAI